MPVDDAFEPDLPVFEQIHTTGPGRAWWASLPSTVADLERQWGVRTGRPYRRGSAGWAAPATMGDGTLAVLKVSWPHREARGEATGLELWAGDGAVYLYRSDPARCALLIERCVPGTDLDAAPLSVEGKLRAAADVLRRLWRRAPAPPVALERVDSVTAEWAGGVHERMDRHHPPYDPGLVELGARLLESLPATANRQAVVHGDFNPGNILRARRCPWLAIDAKPMIGDPGYDPGPLLGQIDPTAAPPVRVVADRYQLFADLVDEAPQRLLAWSVARAVESALWHAANGRLGSGQANIDEAAVLARLAQL